MSDAPPIHEGRPSLGYALALATLVCLVASAGALFTLLLPTELEVAHYIVIGFAGVTALLIYPWQILDAKMRRHALTPTGLIYRCGILITCQTEIPYRSIQAVTITRGIIQRLFGCGDVRVSAFGASGSVFVSPAEMNSVCIRSIPDFEEVARMLRQKMSELPPA